MITTVKTTNLKKEAARSAVTFIKDKSVVGLGSGPVVKYMVDLLAAEVRNGLKIQLVASSFTTQQLLLQKGFIVQPASNFTEIDTYFDGCDQFDKDLNILKYTGGIHTKEKILASMANLFILACDETKYTEAFDTKFPLVIEVLPEAFKYTQSKLEKLFLIAKIALRVSDKNDGPAITANDNYLIDVWFSAWPDLKHINATIKNITGVVETSLFYNLAHKAIIATTDKVNIIDKPVYPLN